MDGNVFEKQKDKNGKSSKLLIGIIAGVVGFLVLIITIIVSVVTAPKTINILEYIDISYDGYEYIGYADVDIDYEAIVKDNMDIFNVDTKQELSSALITIKECIGVEVEDYTNLQNGDEFKIKFNFDNKMLKERYNCVFKCKNINSKVKGLTELTAYNPFDDITVEVSGEYEYQASIELVIDGKYKDTLSSKINKSDIYSICNGVTWEISFKEDELWYAERGLYLTETSKTYTVSGLKEYTDISEGDINKGELNDHILEIKSKIMSELPQVTDVKYIGMVAKQDTDYGRYTGTGMILTFAFKVNVLDDSGQWSYYYTSTFNKVNYECGKEIKLSDYNYSVPSAHMGWFGVVGTGFDKRGEGVVYSGYETFSNLENEALSVGRYERLIMSNVAEK